ncbi:MAG: aminotransferase class IV [Actinomycetota bacterium]|nr:aminotransferase class IV [Actinomycetota bacterium]
MFVWVDGTLSEEGEARISPFDHGLLTGDGVFETLRVYAGQPFCWTRHLERLSRSAAGMGLALPPGDVLRGAAEAVVETNGLSAARLRITVTGGPAPLGSDRGDAVPTVIVAGSALAPWAESVAVATVPWPRNERGALTGLKTISYGENVRALTHAAELGAGEAIFANTRGELCEGTGTNVFVVAGGRLRTPPGSAGCLLGVTRALVLELAGQLGLDAGEEDLPLCAVATADEAFLTSSTREVQAISAVDGAPLPAAPGPITTQLAAAFKALVADSIDP